MLRGQLEHLVKSRRKLVGEGPDGWQHEAILIEHEVIAIDNFSPDSSAGGMANIPLDVFLRNYSNVNWH